MNSMFDTKQESLSQNGREQAYPCQTCPDTRYALRRLVNALNQPYIVGAKF